LVADDPDTISACRALRATGERATFDRHAPPAANLVKLSADIDRRAHMELLTAAVINAAPYITLLIC